MDEKTIVEVHEIRDINTVTTEINTLVNQYRSMTLAYAVEVGRRLTEAKSLLPHGEWGKWLSERVSFSQRTASNLMRVFEEYGDTQITLLGAVPKSQTIADLPLSHAIKLLLLPAEEREEFAEKEDVKHMSVRELDEAIRARKEAEEKALALDEEAERLSEDLQRAEADAQRTALQLKAALDAKDRAEAQLKAAREEEGRAKTDAEKAKAAAKKAKDELKKVKESQTVAPEVMAKLTQEADEKAKAAADEALQKRLAEANRKIEAAVREKQAAEKKYEELRQQAQLADPDVMSFKALFEQVQDDAQKLRSVFNLIKEKDPAKAEKLAGAVKTMTEKLFGGMTAEVSA